jgi:hypothetical protein
VNLPDLDLATMRASPRQRRAAILAIVALGVVALAAAPFARVVLGTFPGMVALYGGAVFTGLAMTATVLFAQFTVTRKPSLLALACGTIFSVVVFVPHILTFPSGTGSQLLPGFPNTSAYLWALWHTVFPASFVAYAIAAQREGTRRVRRGSATIVVLLTLLAAYVCIALVFRFGEILPPLVSGDHYRTGVYAALGVVVVLAGTAIVMLLRRAERTVVDAWLMVPAAAMMIEALVNALGGTRYTVGWYLSRIDIVIATTFLVVALLLETNRLSHFLARSERRLRRPRSSASPRKTSPERRSRGSSPSSRP